MRRYYRRARAAGFAPPRALRFAYRWTRGLPLAALAVGGILFAVGRDLGGPWRQGGAS